VTQIDPNLTGRTDLSIFGLSTSIKDAKLVLLPAPWDVTVSFRQGCHQGPKAIKEISSQVELFHPHFKNIWKKGIAYDDNASNIFNLNSKIRPLAESCIQSLEMGSLPESTQIDQINKASEQVNKWINEKSKRYLKEGKIVGLIGGDHSTPLGLIKALSDTHKSLSILQIDAHMDLRSSYEGFTYSHASIMHNVLKLKNIETLVQIGIRDYSEEELNISKASKKIITFFDRELKQDRFEKGITWKKQCQEIIKNLGENLYISCDIDGLKPHLCPNTGTPVPGGFEFEEIQFLFEEIAKAGIKVIGFDLVEVVPGEIDQIVASRLLYELCSVTLSA